MGKKKENEMSFLEHLEELRWHIIRSLIAIVVCGLVAFIFKKIVFDEIILAPNRPDFFTVRVLCEFGKWLRLNAFCIDIKPMNLISIKMSGQFSMHVMVSLVAGIVIAFPYVFFQFWRFIVPALYPNEKKHARGAIFYSSALFILGVSFGYFIIIPLTINFFGSYSVSDTVTNQINLISYVSNMSSVIIASGIIFEMPILVFFLSKIGIITPQFLKRFRKHSIIVILAMAAIITPPDIFSQLLVSLPLFILYEVSILISKRIVRRQEREALKEEEDK